MPWDDIARSDHARRSSRYASDLTDREWALIAPFLPSPRPIGRPRTTDLREVVNAVLYIAATGCQWRMVPKDLPPSSTVQRYFYDWRDRGLWRKISNHLVMEARELEGREAPAIPSAREAACPRCAAPPVRAGRRHPGGADLCAAHLQGAHGEQLHDDTDDAPHGACVHHRHCRARHGHDRLPPDEPQDRGEVRNRPRCDQCRCTPPGSGKRATVAV